MSKTNLKSSDIPNYALVILYLLTGSLPNFGAIDILAPQWVYFGTVNILSCLYILFFSSDYYSNSFLKLFSSFYIYVYTFYFFWNCLSYFYAVNPVETLINLPRIGNTFFAILFCYLLISKVSNKHNFIYSIFFLFLLAEMISYYYDLSEVYPKEGLRVIAIKGFAGNKNITAASIAFKIPLAIYLYLNSKKLFFRIVSFITLIAGILAVSLIEARAAILSTIIVLLILVNFYIYKLIFEKSDLKKFSIKILSVITPYITLIAGILAVSLIKPSAAILSTIIVLLILVNFYIYKLIFEKSDLKKFSIKILSVITPYLIAFVINILATSFANDKYRKVAITDTIGNISFTEQSSNGRFNYWGDAYRYIKENPIFASGLGNWKIESIDKGKDHISGYTVPYHAHNDFIHVFAETGILGGISYLGLFILLIFYLYRILKRGYYSGSINLKDFILCLPIIVYGVDALLNFPVARPLMQSSFAIYVGLVLAIYLGDDYDLIKEKQKIMVKASFVLILLLLIPGLTIHIISYKSLTQQGRLLYEFNNAQYTYKREELDKISHDFPNLTETAMPIKAMKARYYYLAGKKQEAHEMALKGVKDNPKIHFGNNLKATFFLQENKIDSAYYYAKKAFDGLPNNMPHYDLYMRTLAFKRDAQAINSAFEKVRKVGGDTKSIWTIYLRTLALTRSIGDPFSMAKSQEAFNLYPNDENIFQLYRILTYGQNRIAEADNFSNNAKALFDKGEYSQAAELYVKAFDKDPLRYSIALNAAFSFFNLKDFASALKYFNMSIQSKKDEVSEKGSRFKALCLINLGNRKEGCAEFIKLLNRFPRRMYQQEFNKYCRGN